jgi:predicted short-subunit dehydrogenase-like oxidoreductase (DUF2520 family)
VELSIIGAGRTGRTLGRLARRAGYSIGPVVCRTASHAREAAAFIGAGRPGTELRGSALTIVAVPDSEIPAIARSLRVPRGAVVAHTCAALGAEALGPLQHAGAFHPLRSFGDPARAAAGFEGTACAIDGDARAVRVLGAFARAIGGRPLRVRPGRKALYHAGAVFASNYLIAALDAAIRLLGRAGIPKATAAAALSRLAAGTLENVQAVGIPAALTGPIERGDLDTVRLHVAALAKVPGLLGPYQAMGGLAVGVARAKGSLDRRAASRMSLALVPRKETGRR